MPASRARSTFGSTPVSSNTISVGSIPKSAAALTPFTRPSCADECKNLGADRHLHSEPLQFIFDDLRHVEIDARKNLRLAFE